MVLLLFLASACVMFIAAAILIAQDWQGTVPAPGAGESRENPAGDRGGWRGDPGVGGGGRGDPAGGGGGSAGRVLATLERGPLNVSIRPGSGAGAAKSFSKSYTGRPFPHRDASGLIVSFDILFNDGFEWSCRGKVGGLFVGTGSASGGSYSRDGASHRLMWEGNGDAFSYVYVPQGSHARQPAALGRVSQYGQGVFEQDFRGALAAGRWHRVELGVRLNGAGRADGALLLSVDGKTRVLEGVMWRLGDQDIRAFHLNVFHGGGCTATRTSSLVLKNIEAREWRR